MSRILVAIFTAGCDAPSFTEIENSLQSMQSIVGGYLEAVPMVNYTDSLDLDIHRLGSGNGLWLICNEEGKIGFYPPNRLFPHNVIYGNFFVTRLNQKGEHVDLTPEDQRLLNQWTIAAKWGDF